MQQHKLNPEQELKSLLLLQAQLLGSGQQFSLVFT